MHAGTTWSLTIMGRERAGKCNIRNASDYGGTVTGPHVGWRVLTALTIQTEVVLTARGPRDRKHITDSFFG